MGGPRVQVLKVLRVRLNRLQPDTSVIERSDSILLVLLSRYRWVIQDAIQAIKMGAMLCSIPSWKKQPA
jgi:hypothetical protein